MTNRRDFFKTSSLLIAGSLISNQFLQASVLPAKGKKDIGLQLYSLREAMKADALGTLKLVSDIGFKTLEAANYADGKIYGMTPTQIRKVTKGLGMKLTSAHIGGPIYTKETHSEVMDWWKKALEDHQEAECKFLVKPSMPNMKTLDELKMWCDFYNAIGEKAASSKIQFGYHNHSHEFEKLEGEIIYDYLINHTDPKKVFFEMDVYWVMRGGFKAIDYMNKYPDRFPLLHIKDEKEIGESGQIDFKPIYETAYKNGLKDSFVEVERYNFEPIVSVQKSYDFLKAASYVK
ncbi:MAG TPA: sugar phosphate isomerase/epimerase [Prolixibacteraceae bacterium]|jgi:sugar phosphate isomerase/epimerase|nr:sugar phosphate isomerase/epimerase [Prolixibacteraceae bacterium]